MDEDLYDEFGNYIGPDLDEGSLSGSDSADEDRVPVQEPRPYDGDAMDIDERTNLSSLAIDV